MPFDASQDAYVALRGIVAERTRPILVWTGSGVSVDAGLPTWAELRTQLIAGLRNKAQSLTSADKTRMLKAADFAENEANYWRSFELLAKYLGKTTFRDLVRQPFENAFRVDVPLAYGQLWDLGIKGMLTLNLDRLAGRSLAEARPAQTPIELSGPAVTRLRSNLSGPRPFVLNLHGILEDTDTWVFTERQLSALTTSAEYCSLMDTCLSMFTIIFIGISVDDIAVGGHLERLATMNIETPTHFWVTPIREFHVDKWAESVGMRVVRYDATGGDHTQLAELLDDLRTYISEDKGDAPPVQLAIGPTAAAAPTLPPEGDILRDSPEEIRQLLNAHARHLLEGEDEEAYAAYDAFARQYDQAIYQAWYTTTQPGKNVLLGYRLTAWVARGAFGNVYRAVAPDGSPVAIKVLLDEVRQDQPALMSFRRGVRSMRILQNRGVEGMVAYLAASEIPAFVVMDFVEGPNLTDAKKTRTIDHWHAVIDIAHQLTQVIRRSHMLPERVLHRDIRPSNIMLRNFWADQDKRNVVVLDFDLSWHRGAPEKSVLHTTSVGYLAPEQLRTIKGASTRSAFVDSFGIGMTLLFLCGGTEPVSDQHRHESWADDVRRACESLPAASWVSLPARMARLIMAATRDAQPARWDLAEIERELQLLESVLTDPRTVRAADLLAEEWHLVATACEAICGMTMRRGRARIAHLATVAPGRLDQ